MNSPALAEDNRPADEPNLAAATGGSIANGVLEPPVDLGTGPGNSTRPIGAASPA